MKVFLQPCSFLLRNLFLDQLLHMLFSDALITLDLAFFLDVLFRIQVKVILHLSIDIMLDFLSLTLVVHMSFELYCSCLLLIQLSHPSRVFTFASHLLEQSATKGIGFGESIAFRSPILL